ncbi:MAG: hypothetical protein DRI88_12985, partial [Bacteroidetes bacterium]
MNKLNIISLILVIFIIVNNLQCQTITFEYLLSSPENEIINDVYETADGIIYTGGFSTKPNEFKYKASGLVLKIDNTGLLIDSNIININNRRYCINNIMPEEGIDQYVVAGYISDTLNGWPNNANISISLKRLNNNLEVISEKEYVFPPEYGYWNMLTRRGNNNDLLIGGSVMRTTSIPTIFLYVVNEQFDSIKAKIYNDTTATRTCYGIKQINDTLYWVIDGLLPDYYLADNDLNMTRYGYSVPHWINAPYGIKWDTDTSFYLTGEWNEQPDDDIGFFKQFHPIDSTGNLFNTWGTLDTLDLPAAWDALDYKNKDSIFIGGTTNVWATYYGTWPSWYFIIQTDSMLNVRWERFYGGDAYYVMQKIIAANDGGCIVAGTRYDYQNTTEEELDIHILELNNEGLLVGTDDKPALEMHEALVFPNPGSSYLRVRVAAQYKQSTFMLYDISGKQVLSQ